MTVHHISKPHTKGIRLSYHWEALCGADNAVMFNLYPQYANVGYKKLICQECLNHPDYALLLLSGYFDV